MCKVTHRYVQRGKFHCSACFLMPMRLFPRMFFLNSLGELKIDTNENC